MKANATLRAYLPFAVAIFNGFVALTILSAQPNGSPDSLTKKETTQSKSECGKEAEAKGNMNGVNDFDFFIGHWCVHHRRLKERLAHNHDWEEFEGTSIAQKILGGFGNMDDNVIELPSGAYRAVTFRTYDASKQLWSIWWIDSRNPLHLDPPVVGRFENGVGTFYADDIFRGQPIRVRYLWMNLSTTPHWEQAFSGDRGKTWETNWTMDFTRIR
jgi:hypothetical protein